MLERFIVALRTEDAGAEEPAATRERLRALFPPGATRRMTQLGLLVGAALSELAPREDDHVVYATRYGESRALEAYLDSFPAASPTLFQTSIHPSGIQQALIARRQPVREVFPLSGGAQLVARALLAALTAPAPRAVLCGGEERGTWLLDHGVASDRAFAFALVLAPEAAPAIGRLSLEQTSGAGALSLADWFDLLRQRAAFGGMIAEGWRLQLAWQ